MSEMVMSVGVFFDGSGNNANNLMLSKCGLKHSSISYNNNYTNIYKLFCLYGGGLNNEYEVKTSIYIEGVGTSDGNIDDLFGLAFGIGERGIKSKVDEAINRILKEIKKTNKKISQIKFDVFGFSRGSASALHFANLILDGSLSLKLLETLNSHISVSTRFMGLFDTVVAIGNVKNKFNPGILETDNLKIDCPPQIAKHVIHITARHEFRYNYPLISLKKKAIEISLPGSHSDIGGGYLAVEKNKSHLITPMKFITKKNKDNLKLYMKSFELLFFLKEKSNLSDFKKNINVKFKHKETRRFNLMKSTIIHEKNTFDSSLIALHLMCFIAKNLGVSLLDSHPNVEKNTDLLPLINSAVKQFSHGITKIEFNEEPFFFEKYVNLSANWNFTSPIKPLIGMKNKTYELMHYINRPSKNWNRKIYTI